MLTEIQALKLAIKMWLEVSTDKPNTPLAHNCHLCDFVCTLHNVNPLSPKKFGAPCKVSCPMQGFWSRGRIEFQCEVFSAYADWTEEHDKEAAMYVVDDLKTCLEWWKDLRSQNE